MTESHPVQYRELSTFKAALIDIASDKKAINIRMYDVKDHTWITDYVIVVGVSNTIHCKAVMTALSQAIHDLTVPEFHDLSISELKQSGNAESGWVILDLGIIVIHCIDEPSRDFYKIDDLLEKQGTVYHY